MMSDHPVKLQKAYMLVCLIERYFETDPAGGCLHTILEDGNYGSTSFNIEYSKKYGDWWGEVIGTLLNEFSEEEQKQIIERCWEITGHILK